MKRDRRGARTQEARAMARARQPAAMRAERSPCAPVPLPNTRAFGARHMFHPSILMFYFDAAIAAAAIFRRTSDFDGDITIAFAPRLMPARPLRRAAAADSFRLHEFHAFAAFAGYFFAASLSFSRLRY